MEVYKIDLGILFGLQAMRHLFHSLEAVNISAAVKCLTVRQRRLRRHLKAPSLLPKESCLWKEGRKEGCRARYSQKWLIGVKRSALETRFVLAEGTHQSRCLFF